MKLPSSMRNASRPLWACSACCLLVASSAEAGVLRGGPGAAPNFTRSGAPRRTSGPSDQTSITGRLNDFLDNYDRGVVVRAPDFLFNAGPKPATLWRSDIFPPNQFYGVGGNFEPISYEPLVGYVVDDDVWDQVVLDTYYPHDSNSCDAVQAGNAGPVTGRCTWDNGLWNCPGAYVSGDGGVSVDDSAFGAGSNSCRGCHFDQASDNSWWLDQAWDVVGDYDCNCPDGIDYSSRDAVCEWVQANMIDSGLLANGQWAGDAVTCWVDSPVALSHLQNCYYWKFYGDNWASAAEEWWGWNEIGTSEAVDDPSSWQAIMIFLPSQLAGLGLADLSPDLQQGVEDKLLEFQKNGKLAVGVDYLTERPGSYVVMANEYPDDDAANPNWYHYFFCQSWSWTQIQICFLPQEWDPNGNGYCYLEWAGQACA